MNKSKSVLSFTELSEKLATKSSSDVEKIKAEISQKIKLLDDMLATSKTDIAVEMEPVKELLEKINYLFTKL